MMLEDKITVAIVGGIGSGKHRLIQEVNNHKSLLEQALVGNFWVPPEVECIESRRNDLLLKKYSEDPRCAFEYQMDCMAERLRQHRLTQSLSGLVITGQPLEVDHIYAKANLEHIGEETFRGTYEKLYMEVGQNVSPPEVIVYCRLQPEDVRIAQERLKITQRPYEQKFIDDPAYLIKVFQLFEEAFANGKRKNVITLDARSPALTEGGDKSDLERIFREIRDSIKRYIKPPQLPLDEWEVTDYLQAQKAERIGRKQLIDYLNANQRIITLAGLVGAGKTSFADMLGDRLQIKVSNELSGKNSEIINPFLHDFLESMGNYFAALEENPQGDHHTLLAIVQKTCSALQYHLLPNRLTARDRFYSQGKSYVEDRSPEEDQGIFWRRFNEQSFLIDSDLADLKSKAQATYAQAPKSNLMILLKRSPEECRRLIIQRGREEERKAWPLSALIALSRFYLDFFDEIEQYQSHQGPKIELDLSKFNPANTIHQAYLWQEMLQRSLDYDRTHPPKA